MTGKTAARLEASARGLRLVLLRSAFNADVVAGLADGARGAFLAAGGRARDLLELEVPGAFELPLAAKLCAARRGCDGVVALGAVIKGGTDHYEHIARECAAGLQRAALDTGVPVAFGVLTVHTLEQALERAAPGPENKGAEAVRAAIAMARLKRGLRARRA